MGCGEKEALVMVRQVLECWVHSVLACCFIRYSLQRSKFKSPFSLRGHPHRQYDADVVLYICDCCKQDNPNFPDDPDDEQLCGVGIVLYKAPDDSLFVKVSRTFV